MKCSDQQAKIILVIDASLGNEKARKKLIDAFMFRKKCHCVKPTVTPYGIRRPYIRCRIK